MSGTVLVMAGGTGGHVFPALAVARLLRERGYHIVWLGTRKGLESRVVPAENFPIEWLSVAGLRGNGALGWLLAPLRLSRALWQALGVLRRHRPVAVLGMGGFVTGPGGVAAWLKRRPLVIHEQNAIAGMTNRLLSRLAGTVLEAFPGSFPVQRKPHCVGNPVRHDIASLAEPEQRFGARSGRLRLLVVGGSLGAARLNSAVPGALALFDETERPEVRHQAGERGHAQALEHYARHGVGGQVTAFIQDMAEAYAWADLVVCRAGALTVSELAAAGVGAILVPYPNAVDDHQTHNARYLTEAGAARLIADAELTAERLAAELRELFGGEAHSRLGVLEMARRARERARPDATAVVAQAVLGAANLDTVAGVAA